MRVDVAIVGAGIAGASLAAEISCFTSVALLEAEDQPGFHATGRSAAFWSETYGGPQVRPLTAASLQALARPERSFSDRPFLSPRGEVHLGTAEQRLLLARFAEQFVTLPLPRVTGGALRGLVPGLRAGWSEALWEEGCADIDVGALHAACLRKAQADGARLLTGWALRSASHTHGEWRLRSDRDEIRCGTLVNAAGAWADRVAEAAGTRPLGIQAYRRTVTQVRVDPPSPARLPLVMAADGSFYFKGEGKGRIWLSPHDEIPCAPGDVAAEEIDVATAIHRLEQVVDWRVLSVERAWAGLRTFAPDRLPIYGWDTHVPGLFWCAGQGGFGIQTAPAAAKLAAALLLDRAPDGQVAHIDPAPYRPARF